MLVTRPITLALAIEDSDPMDWVPASPLDSATSRLLRGLLREASLYFAPEDDDTS